MPPDANPSILLSILTFLGATYAVLVVHEIGHALAGALAGYRVVALGVGARGPLFALRWRGTSFYLARPLSLGLTIAFPRTLSPTVGARALFYSGGIVANASCGVAAWLASRGAPASTFLDVLALVSVFSALVNAVPFRIERGPAVLYTDGRRLLDLLRSRVAEADVPPAQIAATARGYRDLCRALGARAGQAAFTLHLALTELGVGDVAAATEALSDPSLEDPSREPWTLPLEKLTRAAHALVTRSADAGSAVEAAAAACAEDPVALAVLRMVEVEVALDAGLEPVDAARAAVEAARRAGRPGMVTNAEALLLEVERPEDPECRACELLGRRGARKLGFAATVRCLATTARSLARAGRHEAARPLMARAIEMLLEAGARVTDPRLRERTLAAMAGPLREAVELAGAAPVPLFIPPVHAKKTPLVRPWVLAFAGSFVVLLAVPALARHFVWKGIAADASEVRARRDAHRRRIAAELGEKVAALRAARAGEPDLVVEAAEADVEHIVCEWRGEADDDMVPELREALAAASAYRRAFPRVAEGEEECE